jgi:teichuronic acid biosynthesis glycosyltransferase TuaC
MPLRVLTFSSLFPSAARPRHGIFVETRLRQLVRDCAVDARVIAPVPWFPSRAEVFGAYAKFAATPRHEVHEDGLRVSHPRYLMLPRFGVPYQPDSMALAATADLRALARSGWVPDIIDAHYFYPDGVAAAQLAERLRIPLVITARGTDVNVLGKMAGTARRILWAAERAAAVIAVSTRLKEALVAMGVDESKVVVLRNGVDVGVFGLEDQAGARQRLGLGLRASPIAACVGNLLAEKGQSLAIESLPALPELQLVIVGDGPMRAALQTLAGRLGVDQRVHFVPTMLQRDLRHLYAAADVLLLTSTREGWPNVVLESLACGTPVVSTDVAGVGEMLTDDGVGRIVAGRDAAGFAAAVAAMLRSAAPREHIRRHAARFDWATISRAQIDVFRGALSRAQPPSVGSAAATPCR